MFKRILQMDREKKKNLYLIHKDEGKEKLQFIKISLNSSKLF